jgi:hypothetical protein
MPKPAEPLDREEVQSDPKIQADAAIVRVAIVAMLIGIMAPPLVNVWQAFRQGSLTPVQVITAVCMSVFASVLVLWILDATRLRAFPSNWMSRAIWALAISSILSAGIGMWKGQFTDRANPFDGLWKVSCWTDSGEQIADAEELIFAYNKPAHRYQGFSSYHFANDKTNGIHHLAATMNAEEGYMQVKMLRSRRETFDLTRDAIFNSESRMVFTNKSPFLKVEFQR